MQRRAFQEHAGSIDSRKAAHTVIAMLSAEYGLEALADVERRRLTMRGSKIANARITRETHTAFQRFPDIQARRVRIPARVPLQAVIGPEEVVELAVERKHLTNLVKMVAYQVESELVRVLAPHYLRTEDEGRTFIQSALASAADIEMPQDQLRVRVAPLSSPRRARALAAVCEELNRAAVRFSGTRLTLRCAAARGYGAGSAPHAVTGSPWPRSEGPG
ncbi:MAG: putative transposase [Planctomycetota bacterium]